MDRRFRIKFDISDFSSFTVPEIKFSVMDSNSSVILVEVLNEGEKIDITNCDVVMFISRPDGKEVLITGIEDEGIEGLIRFNLPNQATSIPSNQYNAEIRILKYGKCVVSRSFNYSVMDTLSNGDSDIISSSEYATLASLINDMRESEKIEIIRQDEEKNRINNENKRVALENERISNESDRQIFAKELKAAEEERVRIFNSLAPEQATNAEVQLARIDISGLQHESLKDRLDKLEQTPSLLWETIEG